MHAHVVNTHAQATATHALTEYKITVGHRPISGHLTKLTAQNVTWLILPSEQVSALSLLPRETSHSFMGRVWICACTGVYQTRGAKSVGVASRTRDRSTCHGKVVSAGKARPRRVNFIAGKSDISKYAPVRRVGNTHLQNYFHTMYTVATVGYT